MMLWPILGIAVALGVGAFLLWERHDMIKTIIHTELRHQRATDIAIAADWFDFDRDTLTYDVEYTDRDGRRSTNRCKVSLRMGSDRSIYWSTPLESRNAR